LRGCRQIFKIYTRITHVDFDDLNQARLMGLIVWKLPAGNMFNITAATLTDFTGGGHPLPIADPTVTQNIVAISFGYRLVPLL
jgi:hypothetical protein